MSDMFHNSLSYVAPIKTHTIETLMGKVPEYKALHISKRTEFEALLLTHPTDDVIMDTLKNYKVDKITNVRKKTYVLIGFPTHDVKL